jgi:hypothetical protein
VSGPARPSIREPARRPCPSCPYRRDAPSGLWAQSEYVKLPGYDRPTGEQPTGLFQCHQTERGYPRARICAGWAGVHRDNPQGHELLSVRLAVAIGVLDDADTVMGYTTDVPLFTSGAVAAAHGMDEIDYPGVGAQRISAKLARQRRDAAQPEEIPDDGA